MRSDSLYDYNSRVRKTKRSNGQPHMSKLLVLQRVNDAIWVCLSLRDPLLVGLKGKPTVDQ